MSIVLRSRKTLAQRYRGVLKKYSTSHLWDFGVAQGPLAYAASHTAAEFIAAHPLWPLWQDTAGTVPACKINDPVGLCLDQPTGVVTLGTPLAINGNFSTSGSWALSAGWAINGGQLVASSAAAFTTALQNLALVEGDTYECTYDVIAVTAGTCRFTMTGGVQVIGGYKSAIGTYTEYLRATAGSSAFGMQAGGGGFTGAFDNVSIRKIIGAHAVQATTTKRPILSGRVNLLTATTTLSTQSITTLAASYKLTFTGSGTVTLSGTYSGSLVSGGSLTFTATAGTLTLTVTGSVTLADLRPANSPTNIPAYQRVTSAADYDTVGFPVRALFDGVDDCLVVPSLDLSLTDKVTVVAGLTKLSDAATGIVCELGSVNGTFYLASAITAGTYRLASKGTTQADNTVSGYIAPIANVISGLLNISGVSNKIKINGGTATEVTSSQGTGNYSASALNIGQRSASSLPFSGSIQSIALIGNLLPDGEVQILESATNAAMGKVY